MEDPLAVIKITFFQECEEQLSELESGLIVMENGLADIETINAVFRAVHSMKGGAGIFGLDTLVRYTHIFETALDKVRSGTLSVTPSVIAVFLRAADLLADLVRATRENSDVDEARIIALSLDFDRINNTDLKTNTTTTASHEDMSSADSVDKKNSWREWNVTFTPYPALYAKANEATLLLREIRRLGESEIELDDSHLPDLQKLDPDGAYLTWRITLKSDCYKQDIFDVFEFVEGDCGLDISCKETDGFEPGTVIVGDNGFKFEFCAPPDEDVADTDAHHIVPSESEKKNLI